MSLLLTSDIRHSIVEELQRTKDQVHIVSAFCKLEALQFIDANVPESIIEKKLLVRFLPGDIIGGATDIKIYDYCKENGWNLFIRFDLHAKTYVFDKKRCILGSANLTGKGLGINSIGNYESASLVDIDDNDISKIESLFETAIPLTDEIIRWMKEDLRDAQNSQTLPNNLTWRDEIRNAVAPSVNALFTYDFPTARQPHSDDPETFEFLGVSSFTTKDDLKNQFLWCKAYIWLCGHLKNCVGHQDYFGSITASLHDVLVNDPKPYRKEVKELLSNMIGWIQYLKLETITIDAPSHSQRLTLMI